MKDYSSISRGDWRWRIAPFVVVAGTEILLDLLWLLVPFCCSNLCRIVVVTGVGLFC